jgi:SecD/SecF fusion protein
MGGTSTTVEFDQAYTLAELDSDVVPLIEDITGDSNVQTQTVEDSNSVIFKTRALTLEEREAFNEMMEENFGVADENIQATNISSTISGEMRSDAMWAVIIATICMLIYIWFRFKDIRFASSAVIALVHDVLVVLAFYALSRTSVGTTFIACMLTLVGYSINATIVIFDRIRENLALTASQRNVDLKEIVNKSITQTLARSINTSLTTFIMVFMLFILGVSSIREFAAPLMVGVICGGYSSVCITGALWYVFKTRFGKSKNK